MKLTIHDVGHGQCISLIHDNGNVMLWDCGRSDENTPSDFLAPMGVTEIHRLFITNYDQDHIEDLENLLKTFRVSRWLRNQSVNANDLRKLKLKTSSKITSAMEILLNTIGGLAPIDKSSPAPEFPNVTFSTYHNNYPEFDDTNDLSLVTFLKVNNTKFIIPGDVEKPGWLELLKNQSFIDNLHDVNVFVASHHGRTNGYCEDVFDYCSPKVVIFSDSNIQYSTQEESDVYGTQASGVNFKGEKRYVLTTRNDGAIVWNWD